MTDATGPCPASEDALTKGAYAFVDLAGFTALTQTHGDQVAASYVDRLCALAAEASTGQTRLAKSIGDAVLLVGPDAADLLASAVTLMSQLARQPAFPLPRAGATAGPAVWRRDDVIGTAVNTAARLAACARGGQLLVDDSLVATAAAHGLATRPVGPLPLRNLRFPVAAFEVDYPDRPGRPVIDPVCRMRLDAADAVAVLRAGTEELHFCSQGCLRTHLDGGAPGDRARPVRAPSQEHGHEVGARNVRLPAGVEVDGTGDLAPRPPGTIREGGMTAAPVPQRSWRLP